MRGIILLLTLACVLPAQAQPLRLADFQNLNASFNGRINTKPAGETKEAAIHPVKFTLLGTGTGFVYGWYLKGRTDSFYVAPQRKLSSAFLNRYTLIGGMAGSVLAGGIAWIINGIATAVASATEPMKQEFKIPEARFENN